MSEKDQGGIPSNDIPVFNEASASGSMYSSTDDGIPNEDVLLSPDVQQDDKGGFADEAFHEPSDDNQRLADDQPEVRSDEDEARARTKKKQMMIKMVGAGVIVLFIGIALVSSWMKAQELKASQNQESAFDQAEEVPPAQDPALNPQPTDVTPPPVNGIDLNNPATMEPLPASAVQPTEQQILQQQAMQQQVIAPEVAPQLDVESRAQIDKLSARVDALEKQIRNMMGTPGLNYTVAKKSKPKQKVKPITVLQDKPLKLTPVAPTVPQSVDQSVKPADVIIPAQPVVAKKVDPCDNWSVKGAVPGMAWLENEGKIVSTKIGDKLDDIGIVVSIDSVNFEVKTRACAIR